MKIKIFSANLVYVVEELAAVGGRAFVDVVSVVAAIPLA